MFATVNFSSFSCCLPEPTQFGQPIIDFFASDQMHRIKEAVATAFARIYTFFNNAEHQPNQINVKTIAMISCLSLIALLVISIIRRRDTRFVPPPAPGRHLSSL